MYATAIALDVPNTYDYEISEIVDSLNQKTAIVGAIYNSNAGYNEYLESEDWNVGLMHLLDVFDKLEMSDVSSGSEKIFTEAQSLVKTIRKLKKIGDDESIESIIAMWPMLREKCQGLVLNIEANSPLKVEIQTCVALDRSLYTKDTWKKLQACLAEAKEVTEYSLNISVARKALAAARANLHEVGFEEDKIRLQTWMSISQDLNSKDYETTSYETLNSHVKSIDLESLKTRSEINDKFELLYNAYNNLELIEYLPETEPTILNFNTLPYFIIAVILFTGAVVSGSFAVSLKSTTLNTPHTLQIPNPN